MAAKEAVKLSSDDVRVVVRALAIYRQTIVRARNSESDDAVKVIRDRQIGDVDRITSVVSEGALF